MKSTITLIVGLLIALNCTSQNTSKTIVTSKDSVCYSLEEAKIIAKAIAEMEICAEQVEVKTLLVQKQQEKIALLEPMLLEQRSINEDLTKQLNDTKAKNQALKRKRLIWGLTGVIVGGAGYAIFVK